MEDKEAKKKKSNSLKSILGGDILATDFFRRQTKLLVLIMVLIIFYIHNRYASQQQQIEIDKLKKELIDIAARGLRIVLAFFPAVGFQMVTSSFFQSIGMAKKAIFLSLTRQLLFLIPCLLILPNIFGEIGVWISIPVADVIAFITALFMLIWQLRYFRQLKTTKA